MHQRSRAQSCLCPVHPVATFFCIPTCPLLPPAPKLVLTDAERARLDESPDAGFYAAPRTMQHVEPQFITALTGDGAAGSMPQPCQAAGQMAAL